MLFLVAAAFACDCKMTIEGPRNSDSGLLDWVVGTTAPLYGHPWTVPDYQTDPARRTWLESLHLKDVERAYITRTECTLDHQWDGDPSGRLDEVVTRYDRFFERGSYYRSPTAGWVGVTHVEDNLRTMLDFLTGQVVQPVPDALRITRERRESGTFPKQVSPARKRSLETWWAEWKDNAVIPPPMKPLPGYRAPRSDILFVPYDVGPSTASSTSWALSWITIQNPQKVTAQTPYIIHWQTFAGTLTLSAGVWKMWEEGNKVRVNRDDLIDVGRLPDFWADRWGDIAAYARGVGATCDQLRYTHRAFWPTHTDGLRCSGGKKP